MISGAKSEEKKRGKIHFGIPIITNRPPGRNIFLSFPHIFQSFYSDFPSCWNLCCRFVALSCYFTSRIKWNERKRFRNSKTRRTPKALCCNIMGNGKRSAAAEQRRAEKKAVKVEQKNKLARLEEPNWICLAVNTYGKECGNSNFARRAACNICKAPNPLRIGPNKTR